MRRLLLPLFLTLALVLPFVSSGDERPRGPWLKLGVGRGGSLRPGQARWFSFRCEAGVAYRIETEDASLRLELYGAKREDVEGVAHAGIHVPAASVPTRRWVRIVNDVDQPVDYLLAWERYRPAPDDHSDTASRATQLELGDPQPGLLERASDRDWFRAELEAKRDYAFALEGPEHLELRLELLDSTGDRLYDATAVTGRRRVFLRPLRAGSYCVQVQDPNGNPPADYTLTWDLARDDHGDTASTAAELRNGRARGALETFEDEDWFVLPLTPGRAHWISYHGVFSIDLIDSDGRSVLDRGEFGVLRTFTPRSAGPYYLRVPADVPGRYAIRVTVE